MLAVLSVTCDGSSTGASSSTAGSSSSGGGHGGNGGAGPEPCVVEGMFEESIPDFDCPLPSPCLTPEYHADGPFPGPDGGMANGPHFEDPTVPACVLQKLRDREIVKVTIDGYPPGDFIGQYLTTETVYIVDAEHGVSDTTKHFDLSRKETRKNRQILRPASYFDACLQETDPAKIYACLTDWSAGCADVEVTCP